MITRHLPNQLTAAKKVLTIFLVVGLLLNVNLKFVLADELVISSNGSESTSEAVVNQTSETTVTQTNNADLQNNITVTTETGGNTIDDSNGPSTIQTGDANQQTHVQNTANTSQVTTECCPSSASTTTISGNGSGSTNSASYTNINSTNATVTQNANIKNNITGVATTGNNRVSDSSGDATIKTGDIRGTTTILNSPVNISYVKVSSGFLASNLSIKGNGSNSYNSASFSFLNPIFVTTNNYATVTNNVFHDFETGNNYASDINGIVKILTGDIFSSVSIKNDVNKSIVELTCLCVPEVKAEEKPSPTPAPSQPSNPSNGGQITPHAASTETPSGPSIFGLSKTSGDVSWDLNPTIIAFFFVLSGLTLLVNGLQRKVLLTIEFTL